MWFKAFAWFILLPSFIEALGTQVSGYNNNRMLMIINEFNGSVADQLDLIRVTWGKLKADYPQDTDKMEDLSETMTQIMCQTERNITLEQHLKAYLIREQIVEHLEILNATEIFRLALSAPEHDKVKWQMRLTQHTQRLHCLCNVEQLRKIYESVIRKIYTPNMAHRMGVLLRQLYKKNNRESYELMVHSELYLYGRYKNSGSHQEMFSIYMAQLWQNIQEDRFYAELDQNTKRRLLDAVIELLNYL